MIEMTPIKLDNGIAIGVSVQYPKTTLLSINTDVGYIMCGVLDVEAVDSLHQDRRIVAARLINVRSFEDMLAAKVVKATKQAENLGIIPGKTTGKQALELMLLQQQQVTA
jgi:uncharacterized protein YunC (DUF1805 family)